MDTYLVLRRHGWAGPTDLETAALRSSEEGGKMQGEVKWIRTYVFPEADGTLGTACVYQATSEEAIRRHAAAADLPATEVLPVAETLIVNADPEPASA